MFHRISSRPWGRRRQHQLLLRPRQLFLHHIRFRFQFRSMFSPVKILQQHNIEIFLNTFEKWSNGWVRFEYKIVWSLRWHGLKRRSSTICNPVNQWFTTFLLLHSKTPVHYLRARNTAVYIQMYRVIRSRSLFKNNFIFLTFLKTHDKK